MQRFTSGDKLACLKIKTDSQSYDELALFRIKMDSKKFIAKVYTKIQLHPNHNRNGLTRL